MVELAELPTNTLNKFMSSQNQILTSIYSIAYCGVPAFNALPYNQKNIKNCKVYVRNPINYRAEC